MQIFLIPQNGEFLKLPIWPQFFLFFTFTRQSICRCYKWFALVRSYNAYNARNAFCIFFFKIWTCMLFNHFHVHYRLAEPRSVCLHPNSACCQEWWQDDRLAECAICGADNSAASGNSRLNIQTRPLQFMGSQNEEKNPPSLFLP